MKYAGDPAPTDWQARIKELNRRLVEHDRQSCRCTGLYAITAYAHDPKSGQLVLWVYPDDNGQINEGGFTDVEVAAIEKHLKQVCSDAMVVIEDYKGDCGYIYSNSNYCFERWVTDDKLAFHIKYNPRAPLELLGYWEHPLSPVDLPKPKAQLCGSQFCRECQKQSMFFLENDNSLNSVNGESAESFPFSQSYNPGPNDKIWCYQTRKTVQLSDNIPDVSCPFRLEILMKMDEEKSTLANSVA